MFARRIAAVLIAASLAAVTVGAVLAIPTPTAPAVSQVAVCGNFDAPANATVGGACYLPTQYHGAPTLDTSAYGTDIPRCASDDWNSDHVARCYTERVTDGAVLIIDQTDTVIATLK
jgi:hypothetical protein